MSKIEVVWFKDLDLWSVKNFTHSLKSNFSLVELRTLIIENNKKVKPFVFPNQNFDILGVNNKEGVYFNETLLGSRIKQPYYQVNGGDIFYNPYRINVGSIGIVPQEFHLKYTSPAYVVFRTNSDMLLAEYLIFVLKSDWFNSYLRANTKGSVRQNLSFNELSNLKIPLPPLEIQKEIVQKIQSIQDKIKALQEEEKRLKEEIEAYIYIALGLERKEEKKRQKVFVVDFKDLESWDVKYNQSGGFEKIQKRCHYPLVPLKSILTYERPDDYIVRSLKYNSKKGVPVLTAGKTFILGYTDELNKVFQDLPVIIFDDFTTATQFVNFKFKVKSSAMKILKNKNDSLSNIKFVFYAMQTIKIDLSLALRRYWISLYQNLSIPLPPLEIQQQIVENIESKQKIIEENKSKIKDLQTNIDKELQELILA